MRIARASVGHTSAGIALPPICFGHIDRGVSDRSAQHILLLPACDQNLAGKRFFLDTVHSPK
jgi:hypothetical protein